MKVENKIEVFEIPDKVTCQICLNKYKKITTSHLQRHKTLMSIYRKKYPDSPITCASTLLKCSVERKKWIKKHPEWTPPPSRLKEYRQDELFMEKSRYYNSLVQNLPHVKKTIGKHSKKRWKNPKYKEKQLECLHKKNKERKNRLKPKAIKMYYEGYMVKEIASKFNITRQTVHSWIGMSGIDKKHLSEVRKKSFSNNPHLRKKMKKIVNDANKIKIKKHKQIKDSLMPRMVQLRNQGWTYQQISNELNIGIGSVYNWINKKTLQ